MFRSIVERTQLSTDIANSIFPNITGSYYNNDRSFISTLRALLPSRMEENDSVDFCVISDGYSESTVNRTPVDEMLDSIIDGDAIGNGQIFIYYFNRSQTDNYACLELLKSSFTEKYSGWHRVEKFTDFFIKLFYSLAFINPEKKSAVMFVDNMDTRKYHYIQCAIPAILPWYFDPAKGLTELERALIESLRKTNADDYRGCIDQFAAQYDFRSAHIRSQLKGFESRNEEARKADVESQISRLDRSIQDYSNQMASLISQKHDKNILLLGLMEKLSQNEEKDSEIMELFLRNDKLELISVDRDTLTFAAKDYLEFFDPEMAASVINNRDSYIYNRIGDYDIDGAQKLLKAIFVDMTVKLRFCAAYSLGLRGSVSAYRDINFDQERAYDGYMPNPHIQRYGCLGDFSIPIQQFLSRFEYIGALQQCVVSCKNLNIGDTTVMSQFIVNLFSSGCKPCIELPDGSVVEPRAALDWIMAQEVSSNE